MLRARKLLSHATTASHAARAWAQLLCALAAFVTVSCGGHTPTALPSATEGRYELVEGGDRRHFVIVLTVDGRIYFKQHEFDLASDQSGETDDALQALHDAMREVPDERAFREKRGPLRVPIRVFYEPTTPVEYLCWVLQATRLPDIKATDVHFICQRRVRNDPP